MPTVLDAPPVAVPPQLTPETHDRHAELDEAQHRWLKDGGSPESVAAYAHALRVLIGDL